MEANAGLVAGSHKRNELVVIRPDNEGVSVCVSFPPSLADLAFFLSFSTLNGILESNGGRMGQCETNCVLPSFLRFCLASTQREKE
jgi:hypothetical protein